MQEIIKTIKETNKTTLNVKDSELAKFKREEFKWSEFGNDKLEKTQEKIFSSDQMELEAYTAEWKYYLSYYEK